MFLQEDAVEGTNKKLKIEEQSAEVESKKPENAEGMRKRKREQEECEVLEVRLHKKLKGEESSVPRPRHEKRLIAALKRILSTSMNFIDGCTEELVTNIVQVLNKRGMHLYS